ncbi:ATP-binding protein [Microbacterium sp.]|uniref:ATP-binding protein n=1 Tax=Microbacterium sp. TaxID=51671 RepID=UPI0037C56DB5
MEAGTQNGFGARLRRHREAAGLSQERLAERAGISANAVGALERGERTRPYPDTVRRLADALGLDDAQRTELAHAVRDGDREQDRGASAPARAVLPGEPTPLIGRDGEIAQLRELLREPGSRILTLVGPGGAGKTRLALRLAHLTAAEQPDDVVWVELAPVADPGLVIATIARAVGLDASGPDAGEAVLGSWFRNRRSLLVLDNVEHVLDAVPGLLRLLDACPGLQSVATSRSPLGVRGEREFPVPPLAVPPADPRALEGDPVDYAAVQLFVWQARQRNPDFALTADRAAAIGAICRRLDGLPLALELVAARTRLLEPEELLGRLDNLMPLLVGGARDLPERQRTMRAAIAWSEELLAPEEGALFRRMSVFASGATLEAVAAVSDDDPPAAEEVLELLEALAGQSLITVSRGGDATRYGMLEPIRQFARERLAHAAEDESTRRRHARYFCDLAERAAQELEGRSDQALWADRLERELDDLRAALDWTERTPDGAATGLRLATALWRFWEMRWLVDEGLARLATALARTDGLAPTMRANALTAAGNLARDAADYERATAYHEECYRIRRNLGLVREVAVSLNNLGVIARDQGNAVRTRTLCQESLELFRRAGDQHGSAIALISLGLAAGRLDDSATARSCLEESLALFRAEGDLWHTAWVSIYLADQLVRDHDIEAARSLAHEGLRLHRQTRDAWGVAAALTALGKADEAEGMLSSAGRRLIEALEAAAEARVERAIPTGLDDLAEVLLRSGEPHRAARLAGAAHALRGAGRRGRAPAPPPDQDALGQALRAEELRHAWAEGEQLSRDDALREAAQAVDAIDDR